MYQKFAEIYGGTTTSRRLERANLLTSGIGLLLPDKFFENASTQRYPYDVIIHREISHKPFCS